MSTEQSSMDRGTIEKTKQQIRGLVHEISQLSKSDLAPEQYYSEFLQRVVQALAAVGGAVWIPEDGLLKLIYQIKLSETLLDRESEDSLRHARLLDHIVQSGEAKLIPPESGAGENRAIGNPTRYLLVLAPLRSGDHVEGVIEIFQRPDAQPATQRGYLQFVSQMCDLAAEWIKTQKLRHFSDRQSLWAQADQFCRLVHEGLDTRLTAYHISNEGRRLIGCDRVSVAIPKGRKFVVESVSGQDTLDNRSNVVAALGRLATKVVATGEAMWYTGSTEDMPPQVEEAVHDYVEESFSRTIFVLPLRKPNSQRAASADDRGTAQRDEDEARGEIIGALIVEQIESNVPRPVLAPRIELVAEHSARALSNSLEHSNLFLMPVWRTLGRASWVLRARTLPKTLAIAGLVLTMLLALVAVPSDFDLEAKGTLQPEIQREVFAAVDGKITDVHVKHKSVVQKGAPLLTMENTDLQVQWQDTLGRRDTALEEFLTADHLLAESGGRLPVDQRNRLSGQKLQARETLKSLDRQLQLLQLKREALEVKSPIAGQIVTWNIEQQLLYRPVKVGDALLNIVDPESPWELVIMMPDKRMAHLERGQEDLGEQLEVVYVLATDPGTKHKGRVKEVSYIAEVDQEEGHSVRIRVAIDQDAAQLMDLRPGATVIANVHCGRRPIGYVWFYQAYEALQRFTFSVF